jgi:hypothetical protein
MQGRKHPVRGFILLGWDIPEGGVFCLGGYFPGSFILLGGIYRGKFYTAWWNTLYPEGATPGSFFLLGGIPYTAGNFITLGGI